MEHETHYQEFAKRAIRLAGIANDKSQGLGFHMCDYVKNKGEEKIFHINIVTGALTNHSTKNTFVSKEITIGYNEAFSVDVMTHTPRVMSDSYDKLQDGRYIHIHDSGNVSYIHVSPIRENWVNISTWYPTGEGGHNLVWLRMKDTIVDQVHGAHACKEYLSRPRELDENDPGRLMHILDTIEPWLMNVQTQQPVP